MSTIKQPPCFREGEQAVVAACILDNRCIPAVVASLQPRDFYYTDTRELFSAIQSLHRDSQPADLVTLTNHLQAKGNRVQRVFMVDACQAALLNCWFFGSLPRIPVYAA